MESSPTIVYFSIADQAYPRNARIRRYLETEFGATVVIPDEGIRTDGPRGKLRRFGSLIKNSRGASVIVLAEFATKYALPARLVARARGAALVVDGFVGLHETKVDDWNLYTPRSSRAFIYRLFDWLAVLCADLYLIDTDVRAEEISQRYGSGAKVVAIPVGAPRWASAALDENCAADESPELRLLYYGNYIPLHGLDIVVEAMSDPRLHGRIRATFVGDGGLKPQVVQQARELGLVDTVTFLPPVPEDQLIDHIREADVVLGIFGRSVKAQTVIANKVWQGLASGRIVVTQTSPALQEIVPVVDSQLRQVSATPESVADEFVALLNRSARQPPDLEASGRLERYVESSYTKFGDKLSTLRGWRV